MNLGKLNRALSALQKAHRNAVSADLIENAAGRLSDEDLQSRYDKRLQEIADLEIGGFEFLKAVETEKRVEALKKRRLRWMKYTRGIWHSKPDDDIDWTKAQKAVLVALMSASRGKRVFEVAHEWIAKKSGTGKTTVKDTIKLMEAEGLLSKEVRRIDRQRNAWNLYTITSAKLLNWARRMFRREGSETRLDLGTIGSSVSTEDRICEEIETPETPDKPVIACRQKAMRDVGGETHLGIPSEDFALLATGALKELGVELSNEPSPDELISTIEAFRAKKNPNYKHWFWEQGIKRHGYGRALLSVLSTHITKQMRLCAIPDARPRNERETVKCTNRYLSGLLDNRTPCRPELTLGSVLLAKQVYELPVELVRKIRAHNSTRSGLKPYQSSAK